MWRLEKDPYLSSTFGTVSILDRPPDVDRLRARMERAIWNVPRLRWRVQPAPVNLSAPMWVDDPDFDIDHHVRHIALPKPGTLRQLLDLATLIALDPFDRTRPLWQFVVVDGLRGGKSAIVQKMHHTITDGEGGVQMSLQFLDFERDAPDPPPIDPAAIEAPPPPPPSAAGTLRGPAARRVPAADRRGPPGHRAARRPGGHPGRQRGDRRHRARRHLPALRRRAGELAAVDAALAEAPLRGRAGAVPSDQGRRQAARRHAQHRLPHRGRRGCRRATTTSSAHRSSSCGRRWRSAPARPTPAPTPSPWPV